MKKFILALSILVGLPCYAATTNVSTQAKATLSSSCQVQLADINLGTITPGEPSSSGTTQVNIRCTKGTPYSWYPSFRQAGWDCPFLTGKNSGDKMYYMFYYANQYQVYTSNMDVNPATSTGTGDWTQSPLQAFVQPNQSYSTCPRKPSNPGFNPFVTPDVYSDSNTIVINF